MDTKTLASNHNDPENVNIETELTTDQFKTFKLFLNVIKPTFHDLNLIGGSFRAFSNNNKCIVETGFRFFSGMNLHWRNIRSIYKTISKFGKYGSITFTLKDDELIIKDYYGEVRLPNYDDEYLENKYISDDELFKFMLKNIDPDNLFVNEALSKKQVCRMKTVFQKLSANHVNIKHINNNLIKGVLSISGKEADSPELQKELLRPLLIPLENNQYFQIPKLPWFFNKDDMYLKCYLQKDKKVNVVCNTNLNDLYVNIYSQSELLERE